jgi:hypothetical protein
VAIKKTEKTQNTVAGDRQYTLHPKPPAARFVEYGIST